MPGLVGGAGCPPQLLDRLEREFRAVFPDCELHCDSDMLIAGHAFSPWSSIFPQAGRSWAGVDGEASLYAACGTAAGRTVTGAGLPCTRRRGHLVLDNPAVGNCVVVDADEVLLVSDWTATFPLYYAQPDGGFVFCSLLQPLARALGASPDPIGVMEFLRDGYTVGTRTQFQGVSRVVGGQSLRWTRAGGLAVAEQSKAHAGEEPAYARREAAAEAAASALSETLRRLPAGDAASMMVSGGWDSRTLLAVAAAARPDLALHGYSHGDLESRELHLAQRVCQLGRVPWRGEPLDDRLYDLDALRTGFARTGNVEFPHWHRAGRLLADERLLLAGVFGEMLGGRYWSAHTATGPRKALMLFGTLLRPRPRPQLPLGEARQQARRLFRTHDMERPWCLRAGALPDLAATVEAIEGDIDACFERYQARGVANVDQYAEAFQADHTGSRFCNVQLLSCRAHMDIALPMANRSLLDIVTRTPFPVRLNNSLNRAIIARLDRRFLRYPMAATLLPATAPIALQEASRIARILLQRGRSALTAASGGRVPLPRLSWPNYDFLASGTALRRVIGELQADIWDREALEARSRALRGKHTLLEFLVMADQIGRILTTDLLLR